MNVHLKRKWFKCEDKTVNLGE